MIWWESTRDTTSLLKMKVNNLHNNLQYEINQNDSPDKTD